MKSSKLIEIFKQGNMVIPIYLLQHYKGFKLNMEEFVFLMYLYNLGNKLTSPIIAKPLCKIDKLC